MTISDVYNASRQAQLDQQQAKTEERLQLRDLAVRIRISEGYFFETKPYTLATVTKIQKKLVTDRSKNIDDIPLEVLVEFVNCVKKVEDYEKGITLEFPLLIGI